MNLSRAFFLSRAALARMAECGTGRIVNVSSVIGQIGNIGQANYAASKSGLFGPTKTLAREAAFLLARAGKLEDPTRIGLTVNTVTPRIRGDGDARAHPAQDHAEDPGADPARAARPPRSTGAPRASG